MGVPVGKMSHKEWGLFIQGVAQELSEIGSAAEGGPAAISAHVDKCKPSTYAIDLYALLHTLGQEDKIID